MRLFVLTAALLALLVVAGYGMLVVFVGVSPTASNNAPAAAPTVKFVPPLEYLAERSRQRTEASSSTATASKAFHTKAAAPKMHVFQTAYRGGTQIVFNHEKHVKDLGLECIECHHVERCSKCHVRDGDQTMRVVNGKQTMHENCIACHAATAGPQKCDECHRQ